MQSNRPVVLGLIVTALAVLACFVYFAQGGEPTAPPAAEGIGEPAVAAPAHVTVEGGTATADAAPAKDAVVRVPVPAGSAGDEHRPGLVGRVVGPDGRPIAGARVGVAPRLSFADESGQFDLQSLDPGNLEGIVSGGFDADAMLRSVRQQMADRTEVETDAEGRFRVVARGASRALNLRVLAHGHGILDRRCDSPRDQDVDVGTLALRAAAIVSGRVLTPDGAPIAGARVGRVSELEQRLLDGIRFDIPEMGEVETLRGGEAAITDELGQFELAHVAPGELTLRARHPEHPTATSQRMTVEAGRLGQPVLLTMEVGGVITGVVHGLPADAKSLQVLAARKLKADAGDPSGAGVAASLLGNLGVQLDEVMGEAGIGFGERKASIGDDGKFELRGLARDTYRVWVARTRGVAGNTACSARVEASPGSTVDLLFEQGVAVTFTVVDAKSGAPIERMRVRDRLRGDGGIADVLGGMAAGGGMPSRGPAHYPKGVVTIAHLRPKAKQKLSLSIEAVGYAPLERRDLELPQAGSLDLGALALESVPVLRVTVVAAADGRPVPGASVRLAGGDGPGTRGALRDLRRLLPAGNGGGLGSGRTDGDGRVTLNRPPQAATLEVEAKGFARCAIALSAETPDEYTAKLLVGGAVAVTVCDVAEQPVPGAFVEHRAPDGSVDSARSDRQGVARFDNLVPGVHQFHLGKPGGGLGRALMRRGGRGGASADPAPSADEPSWQAIVVADQAASALRLVVQPTATLRGIVRANGLPLSGARVTFRAGAAAGDGDWVAEALGDLRDQMARGAAGGASRSPRTDEHGGYELRELPAGEHQLRVTHESRAMPTTVRIVLRNGDNVVDVDLDMTTLRGVVTDSGGKPVEGASIRIRRSRPGGDSAREIGDALEGMAGRSRRGGGGTKTDATGAFEVRGIEPDVELEVHAAATGFAPAAAKVTAARGATTAAPALVLVAAGSLRVSVAGNQPFGALRARWLGPGEGVAPVLGMLRGGKGTLEGLRPGPWEVSLESMGSLGARLGESSGGGQGGQPQPPAQPQPKRTVDVIAGRTVDIDL